MNLNNLQFLEMDICMGVVMNWKVKTKNMDNEIRILYLDANNKDEVRKEVQDEYIISIKRNYKIFFCF